MTEVPSYSSPFNAIRFTVAAHAAWAPGRDTDTAWQAWADSPAGGSASEVLASEPPLPEMPAMLRRRASPSGKMALQAAYRAIATGADGSFDVPDEIPTVFCSRHGECSRSAALLADLVDGAPMSPAAFSLSVHNASAGLFSIARGDRSGSVALAAGTATVEHAAIEACGLLADGAPAVLLVVSDSPPPEMYGQFADCGEQPFGWAWLLVPAEADADADTNTHAAGSAAGLQTIALGWHSEPMAADVVLQAPEHVQHDEPAGLQIMRFFLRGDTVLKRHTPGRMWQWSRNA